ncbi:hypothetical protein BJ170DRAFT_641396 [Xylariales sp. AK1849]|nr:hypothetical protein BJ170DRAFT_641396 [Xylariales sp. AK1849]
MRYLALLGATVTAVGACSHCPLDSAPGTARALDSHFDLTHLPDNHIIKYTPSARAEPETSGFSYTEARSDQWVPIDPQFVSVPQREGATTIQIDPLQLDPNTRYQLRYLVDNSDGRQDTSAEFSPPRSDDTQTSSLTSDTSSSANSRSTTTSQPSYWSTTSTPASTMQSSLSTTQAQIDTATQDLYPSSTSAIPSASTMDSGAPGTFHGLAACFWALLVFLAFWEV